MTDRVSTNLKALKRFLGEKGWRIFSQKDIDYGHQVIVTDGSMRLPVNFFNTGKIVVQGKPCEMKTALTEWANLIQAGLSPEAAIGAPAPQNRVAKYLVIPDKIEKIHQVVLNLPGEVIEREVGGPAEVYRVEVRHEGYKVTITQYGSGTLMVQGLSSTHFDTVCEALDEHLSQSFVDRATRFIAGETERSTAAAYLEKPEAENEAACWLLEQINQDVLKFLYDNDRRTLLAAAGVRNAFQSTSQSLPDYSVVVMPFAKSFEGFLMRLAVHLELTTEDALRQKANEIEIGAWIETIRARLPDVKRYGEIHAALADAWQCRHKALHSDFAHPLSTLATFVEADREVATILRAMARAYRVFVEEGLKLAPVQSPEGGAKAASEPEDEYKYEQVDREHLRKQLEADGLSVSVQSEGRKNVWEIITPELTVIAPRAQEGLIIVKGSKGAEFCAKYKAILTGESPKLNQTTSLARIGVDESGKGDLFGPLVIAGVVLTQESEIVLARRGVRDSKTLSDAQILELARLIRMHCPVEVLVLLPPDYNIAYEQHGRNLNRLLAWGHAQVITKLSRRVSVDKAISDQFGDESLLVEALAAEVCRVPVEQRPHAENDLAVAAASVIARAEFIAAIQDYTQKAGIDIPLGASANQVKEIGKQIYRRWGRRGLERIAKMHFKTIQEIISEADK
ncbi:MAG: ribonuclease HIII [Candidatus Methanomethylicaceae archaeon]